MGDRTGTVIAALIGLIGVIFTGTITMRGQDIAIEKARKEGYEMAQNDSLANTPTGTSVSYAALGDIKFIINGESFIPKDNNNNVIEPFNVDGRIYLPVSEIAETLGCKVNWDEKAKILSIKTNTNAEASVTVNDEWLPLSASYNIDMALGALTRDSDILKHGEDSFQNGIVSYFGGSMRNFLTRIDGLNFDKMKISVYSEKNIIIQVVDRSSGEIYKEIYAPGNQVTAAEFSIYYAPKIDIMSREMITHTVILGDIFFK